MTDYIHRNRDYRRTLAGEPLLEHGGDMNHYSPSTEMR